MVPVELYRGTPAPNFRSCEVGHGRWPPDGRPWERFIENRTLLIGATLIGTLSAMVSPVIPCVHAYDPSLD